jgi:hypothetical protein
MESKQTAVEWLVEIYLTTGIDRNVHFHQALAMEKEQIISANEDCSTNELGELFTGEQYYNETYINKDDKQPRVSDDFQIGPDGAYEHNSDWDVTLMDGLEYESWDELYDDYVGEADLHEFVQWLKDNFQVPNKLGPQNP